MSGFGDTISTLFHVSPNDFSSDEYCENSNFGSHYVSRREAQLLQCCDWLYETSKEKVEEEYCDRILDEPENDCDNADLNVSDDHEDEFMDILYSLEPVLSAKAIKNLLNDFYDKESERMLEEWATRQKMELNERTNPEVIEVQKMRRVNKRYSIGGVDTRRTRAGRRIGGNHRTSINIFTRQEEVTNIIVNDQVFKVS